MEVLQFSGGKDSLACLFLLRPRWDAITVLWTNPGTPFPETVAIMERVKALVPHFVEVRTDVTSDIASHGMPVDVVPFQQTGLGKAITSADGPKLRTWYECCRTNVWIPMDAATRKLGATVVYRGQRNSEQYKSPLPSGTVVDGVRYVFPIADWTDSQVTEYLTSLGEMPEYYAHVDKGLDCVNCTAYLDEKQRLFKYMKSRHPEKYAAVIDALQSIRVVTEKQLAPLMEITGA
jgi:3'-phosphoadenosine 5'-phosphosulfate sulfotransferase (PAPS reductase)/FAD synthetase